MYNNVRKYAEMCSGSVSKRVRKGSCTLLGTLSIFPLFIRLYLSYRLVV
jgi:hypothetical protein